MLHTNKAHGQACVGNRYFCAPLNGSGTWKLGTHGYTVEAWHARCTWKLAAGRGKTTSRERRTWESHAVKGWTRFCGRHSWTAEGMQLHFMENSQTQLSVVLHVCTQGHRRRTIRSPVFYNGRVCLFWGLGQSPSRLTHFPSFIRTSNITCKNDIQVRA